MKEKRSYREREGRSGSRAEMENRANGINALREEEMEEWGRSKE